MTDMTPEARAELRRLADAATPGPWVATWETADDWWSVTGQSHDGLVCPEVAASAADDGYDAAFIAAANPETVKALLDENERLVHWKAAAVLALADLRARAEVAEAAVGRVRAVLDRDLRASAHNAAVTIDRIGDLIPRPTAGDYRRALDTPPPTDREDDR